MIEEFPFTTRVLQAEKDINSLNFFIAQAVRETKERVALLTWPRLTWEQRVTWHSKVLCSVDTKTTSKIAAIKNAEGNITMSFDALKFEQDKAHYLVFFKNSPTRTGFAFLFTTEYTNKFWANVHNSNQPYRSIWY